MRSRAGRLIGHLDWPYTLYFLERAMLLERLLDVANASGVEIRTSSEVTKADPDGRDFWNRDFKA